MSQEAAFKFNNLKLFERKIKIFTLNTTLISMSGYMMWPEARFLLVHYSSDAFMGNLQNCVTY